MNAHISRRTVAKGVAWSVPAITAASAAPAFAASPCVGGCYTMNWGDWAMGTSVDGQTGQTVSTDAACSSSLTVQIDVDMSGTASTLNANTVTGSSGKYNSTYNGKVGYLGEQNGYVGTNAWNIRGVSDADPGMVLNIGSNTKTTVTFRFSQAVSSVELDILDITRITDTTNSNRYHCQDTVSFSHDVRVTGDMNSANVVSGATLRAGEPFHRTARYPSLPDRPVSNTFAATGSITTFNVTYSAPVADGWQFIALGDPRFCL